MIHCTSLLEPEACLVDNVRTRCALMFSVPVYVSLALGLEVPVKPLDSATVNVGLITVAEVVALWEYAGVVASKGIYAPMKRWFSTHVPDPVPLATYT
jgi:hypothetical protein